MARNRKNQSAAIRFVPTLKAALLCAFLGGASIGTVWQKNQLLELGRSIRESEKRLGELRQANEKLKKQVLTLRSPAILERRLRELRLDLVQPSQAQILRLPEVAPGELRHPPLLAEQAR